MKPSFAATAALSFGSAVYAQAIARTCPQTDLCYSLSIPEITAQSGNGDIYFQISAPTSYQWVALGQGTGMSGANMFIMYTSANGQNVTISPRLGTGHIEPQHDTNAQITLLDGSGVSDNKMVANIKCSNCQSWSGGSMDFTGNSADWIYGYKSGDSLNTDDITADISRHDDAESFEWNFAQAKGSDSMNPFVSSAGAPTAASGSTNATSSSSNNSTDSATHSNHKAPFGGNSVMGDHIIMAHGILASIAFVALLPTGGILIRLASFAGLVWVHVALQLLALGFYIIAFAMGVYLASELDLFDNHHPIVGIVLLIALVIQPLSGFLHHRFFKKYDRRTGWSFEHLSIGRIAILLGLINGGNGLRLAGASFGAKVAYGICAAGMAVIYIASIFVGERQRKLKLRGQPGYLDSQRVQSRGLDSQGGQSAVQLHEHFSNKA